MSAIPEMAEISCGCRCCTPLWEYAQAVIVSCPGIIKCTRPAIARAMASNRCGDGMPVEAKAQTRFARPWGEKLVRSRCETPAMASKSRRCGWLVVANAHAALDRSCAVKSRI